MVSGAGRHSPHHTEPPRGTHPGPLFPSPPPRVGAGNEQVSSRRDASAQSRCPRPLGPRGPQRRVPNPRCRDGGPCQQTSCFPTVAGPAPLRGPQGTGRQTRALLVRSEAPASFLAAVTPPAQAVPEPGPSVVRARAQPLQPRPLLPARHWPHGPSSAPAGHATPRPPPSTPCTSGCRVGSSQKMDRKTNISKAVRKGQSQTQGQAEPPQCPWPAALLGMPVGPVTRPRGRNAAAGTGSDPQPGPQPAVHATTTRMAGAGAGRTGLALWAGGLSCGGCGGREGGDRGHASAPHRPLLCWPWAAGRLPGAFPP